MFTNRPSFCNQILPNPFRNFPVSQKTPAHMAQHDLGNWEMASGTYFPISQMTPAHLALYYLGNWEMVTGTYFPISQFPKRPQPIWLSTIWEIGKWEMATGTLYILPNFPTSQKISAHLAQHYLGHWEIGKWLQVHTSQFPKRSQPRWPSTIWELGKSVEVYTSQFPKKVPAQMAQNYLGNWELSTSCNLNKP